jgi:hypothetical protein
VEELEIFKCLVRSQFQLVRCPNMSLSPSSAIHRTGPLPLAGDYSKTLLNALVDDDLQIGPVSRVQLLLATMVERVHDAIYVLPRHARDKVTGAEGQSSSSVDPDPEEYARDVFTAIKGLEKYCEFLPDDLSDYNERIQQLNSEIVELRVENERMLAAGREIEKRFP